MQALEWLRANPAITGLMLYVLFGVLHALFKPATLEGLPRWRIALHKFWAGTGLDITKLTEMLVVLLKLPAPGDGSHDSKPKLPASCDHDGDCEHKAPKG